MSNPIHDESLLRGFTNKHTAHNRLRQAITKRRSAELDFATFGRFIPTYMIMTARTS